MSTRLLDPSGQGERVAAALAVFFDDGAQFGKSVEGWRGRFCSGITLAEVEDHGVSRLLYELEADLRLGDVPSDPGPAGIHTEAGDRGAEALSMPAVRDRVVQAAAMIVLEPVFEADFLPCSFGLALSARRTTGCRCS